MQRKLITSWSGGVIETNPLTGTITIRQGTNSITVFQSDRDAFSTDLDNCPYVQGQPTGVGFGGTIAPIAPKKSMSDIIRELELNAKASASWPYHT